MRSLTGNPRLSIRWLLIVLAIPGILLWLDLIQTPSEIENQFLFGLSKARLLLAVVFSCLLILNIGGLIWTSLKLTQRQLQFENRLTAWVGRHATAIYVELCLTALLTGIVLLVIIPPVIRVFASIEQAAVQAGGFLFWLFLASALFAVFLRLIFNEYFHDDPTTLGLERFLLLAALFLVVFFTYEHLLIWTGAANQSRYSYWNHLAEAFLQGKLHLENPPETHDLTLYNGKWYVPMPPAPAILMLPLASLIGGENINTSDFSIVLSAVNAVLVYLILEQFIRHKWLRLSWAAMFLLVVLFAFGTPHLWVGVRGRAWFVSQIVTVAFLALAVYGSLKSWSPWWVGTCIGFAIAARPNGLMSWPFVFAIAMQILKEKSGSVNFGDMLGWSVRSALPVGVAVAGLLFYNQARFGNAFDFGYVTISGDPTIVANAQTYGIFSPHYIPANLKAMFFYIPAIQPGAQWPILPSTTGMSLFLVTPPLLYLFHRYERQWWIIGAWASVFLNFLLLVLYHNTGAHQFGYRYILDAGVPVITLLAAALGNKIPWHFILLLLFSIAFNIYGTYWFING